LPHPVITVRRASITGSAKHSVENKFFIAARSLSARQQVMINRGLRIDLGEGRMPGQAFPKADTE
jgi:hypothetical protein